MCDGPEEPPPGRFGFKKHAGLIRVNLIVLTAGAVTSFMAPLIFFVIKL